MEQILDILHKSAFTGMVSIFFLEAIILLLRGKNNRARIALGIALLIWAVTYLVVLVRMYTAPLPKYDTLYRANIEIMANYFLLLIYYFPLQALNPERLKLKKSVLFLLPLLAITIIYYGGLFLLDEPCEDIYTYKQLRASLGHFNVWFRFIILLTNVFYIVLVIRWINVLRIKYIRVKNENFADQEKIDVSWLQMYNVIIPVLFVCFVIALVIGGRLAIIVHAFMHIVLFSYLFYKALFFVNPFEKDMGTENAVHITKEENEAAEETLYVTDTLLDSTFPNQIDSYTRALKQWMENDKPYLFKDFKLMDAARILPLNRTYLSRVFNEGFGKNFGEVVREYRIAYAMELMKKQMMMPIYQVADLSGFSSDSTFNRAFKQVTGITPAQFKAQLKD